MKWFKHFTKSKRNKKLMSFCDKVGFHFGYSCYFILLEYYAESYDGKSKSVFIRKKNLRDLLETSQRKLSTTLLLLESHGLINVMEVESVYEIIIPKFLERMEKYTKKIEKISKKSPLDIEEEEEEEEEVYKIKKENDNQEKKTKDPTDKYKNERVEIIEYLNDVACKNYSPNSDIAVEFIDARFKEKKGKKENISVDDFKLVIDYCKTEYPYKEKPKYLRPQTLFTKKKFYEHLEEAKQDCNKAAFGIKKQQDLRDMINGMEIITEEN